jgi:hypothetical protein
MKNVKNLLHFSFFIFHSVREPGERSLKECPYAALLWYYKRFQET